MTFSTLRILVSRQKKYRSSDSSGYMYNLPPLPPLSPPTLMYLLPQIYNRCIARATTRTHPMPTPGTFHTRTNHSTDAQFRIPDKIIRLRHTFINLTRHIMEILARATHHKHLCNRVRTPRTGLRVMAEEFGGTSGSRTGWTREGETCVL